MTGRALVTMLLAVVTITLLKSLWMLPTYDTITRALWETAIILLLAMILRDLVRMLLKPHERLPEYTRNEMADAWERAHLQAVAHLRMVGHHQSADDLSRTPNPYKENRR